MLATSRRTFLKATIGLASLPLCSATHTTHASSVTVAPGEWLELPGTALEKVFPPRDGHPAWAGGPRAVTGAWGGGAFDSRRNVFVLTGGGHGDYGGNEVYEFHLDALRWVRATEPSPMRALGGGKFESIGSEAPVSSHTYDGLVYLPNVDRVFKFGGSYYSSGLSYDHHAYLYSVAQHTWKRGSAAPMGCIEAACDYDPKAGCAIVSCGTGLLYYYPTADSWQSGSQTSPWSAASCVAIDTHARLFVQTMSNTGALAYFDLDRHSERLRTPLTGTQPWGPHPGLIYHPGIRRLVIWGGDRDVWLVRPGNWSVTRITPRTGPQAPANSNGIYGRWQYMPDFDAFIGYVRATDNVWLFRLPT